MITINWQEWSIECLAQHLRSAEKPRCPFWPSTSLSQYSADWRRWADAAALPARARPAHRVARVARHPDAAPGLGPAGAIRSPEMNAQHSRMGVFAGPPSAT